MCSASRADGRIVAEEHTLVSDRNSADMTPSSNEAAGPPAPRPCISCPYRRDVPSGVWDFDEYEKLRDYDNDMATQPNALFQCHQTDADADTRRLCAGWAACHGDNLLALRTALIAERISPATFEATINYRSPNPLFDTGTDAADHGQADIPNPSPAAQRAIDKISRRRSDLINILDQPAVPVSVEHRVQTTLDSQLAGARTAAAEEAGARVMEANRQPANPVSYRV